MRRSLLVALGVAALALAAPAGAGQVQRFDTRVTLKDDCPSPFIVSCRTLARRNYVATFKGRLVSDKPSCERRRTVKLIRVASKPPGDDPEVIATVKSDAQGRWRFETAPESKPGDGEYVAKATRRRRGDIVCKRDASNRETHDVVI